MIDVVAPLVRRAAGVLDLGRHPLLLLVRVAWGWPLMWNGWGKLHHLSDIAAWFGDELGLPFPYANAVAAGTTEFLGGLLLFLGLASRPAGLAVAFTMTVAFLTSDREALATLTTDPFCDDGTVLGSCFTLSAPFPYWFAALLVLVFGPGAASVDAAILRWWTQREAAGGR